jgi:hypothetical protein
MRTFIAGILVLFSLLSLSIAPAALADDACRCKGCGCKGGSGWRGPDGFCVASSKLADICGSPPAAPCKLEAAARVCFGRQSALTAPAGTTAPQ